MEEYLFIGGSAHGHKSRMSHPVPIAVMSPPVTTYRAENGAIYSHPRPYSGYRRVDHGDAIFYAEKTMTHDDAVAAYEAELAKA